MNRLYSFFIALFFSCTLQSQPCSTALRPIVFVHGFLASGDTWAPQIQRFASNGYCEERLWAFDWNSLGGRQGTDSLLDAFINNVLKQTASVQVDLVGHSAGGGLCYGYLKDSVRAAKVAHYAHIGSNKMKAAAGPNGQLPTLNIYSDSDKVVRGGGDIPGAANERLHGLDHLQVATSAASFRALFNFFNGTPPSTTDIQPTTGLLRIGGRSVALGTNEPLVGDSFRVHLYSPLTGQYLPAKRKGPTGPYQDWKTFGPQGEWRLLVPPHQYLEYSLRPANGRPLFYYMEPPLRSNPACYLRALPTSGMAATMLKGIPNDTVQMALVIFTASQAVISGRDSLRVDGRSLSLPTLASAGKTAIAHFVFDDGDGSSSGSPIKQFANLPFLSGVDLRLPAGKGLIAIEYNGRRLMVPRRKSSEGITVVVFN